jgi:hypothetical protein
MAWQMETGSPTRVFAVWCWVACFQDEVCRHLTSSINGNSNDEKCWKQMIPTCGALAAQSALLNWLVDLALGSSGVQATVWLTLASSATTRARRAAATWPRASSLPTPPA